MKKGVKLWCLIVILMVVSSGIVTMASAGLGIIPDYPKIREVNHDIRGIGYNSSQIHSTAVLYNPNIFPIKFKRVEYSIFLNDILIGSGHSDENVMVLPRSEKRLAFESKIYLKQIPKCLKERIKTKKETDVNIKGDIIFDLGLFDYKHPINISVTELWKKRFNNSFSFAYPVTDLTGDKISEMIIDVWHLEEDYISGEVRVVDGVDGSLLWNRSLGVGIPVAYPATDLNGDNVTDFIVNVWDIDRNWATRILILDGVDGSNLWEWEDEDGLAAAYPCTDFNGDKITEIVINSYSFVMEETSTPTVTYSQHNYSKIQAQIQMGVNSASIMLDDENNDKVPETDFASSLAPAELIMFTHSAKNDPRENFEHGYSHENERMKKDLHSLPPNSVNEETNVKERIYIIGQTLPDPYEPDDNYAQANWISTSGTKQTHNFHVSGDHDWVKFNANENINYLIETSDLGSESDTYMYLYDRNGLTEITHDDDSGEGLASRIVWKCDSSGVYYVKGRHYNSSVCGLNTHYNISVLEGYVPSAEITGVYSDYGIDADGDGKYDYFVIDVGIKVNEAGRYGMWGYLQDSTDHRITRIWNSTYFEQGSHNLMLRFNGYEIYRKGIDGPFMFDYVLYQWVERWNIIDRGNNVYSTSFYSYTDFDKPPIDLTGAYSDYGVDTDGDGKYDYLAIDVGVNVIGDGTFEVYGRLHDSEDQRITSDWDEADLSIGLHKFTLKFDGYDIYRNSVDGPFNLGYVELYDEWNRADYKYDAYVTSYYSYRDFDKPPAEFTGNFDDYGMDTDGDGLYNYLVIEAEINVTRAEEYELYGSLRTPSGEWIDSDYNRTYLDVGIHNITLQFEGVVIYNTEYSGSFRAWLELQVYEEEEWKEIDEEEYFTDYYDYTDFDKPPAEFTGNFDDYGVDTDGDGLYNYLVIEAEINVTEEREYAFWDDLYYYNETTGYWEYGVDCRKHNYSYLDPGVHNLTIKLSGIEIRDLRYSGTFKIRIYLDGRVSGEWLRIDEDEYYTGYYDYTEFQVPPAEFTGNFSDYGVDTDGDGLYNYLVIEAEINVTEEREYEFWDDLYYYNETTGYWEYGVDCRKHNYSYLDPGVHNLTIKLSGIEIRDLKYNGTFKVKLYLDGKVSGEWLKIDEDEHYTKSYNYTAFQIPPAEFTGNFTDYGLDTDEDTLYNYLVIEAEVNVTKAGVYELSGDLTYKREEEGIPTPSIRIDYDYNRTYLDAGTHNITLQFDGIAIYNAKHNGSFRTWLRLYETEEGNRIDEMEYFTQSYNYTEFQKPPAEFTGNFIDYGLDTDEDTLYNYLVVEAEVNVTKAGVYELSGDLTYQREEEGIPTPSIRIDDDWNRTYLEIGIHNITLKFDGWRIYNTECNGSFRAYLRLYETEEWNRIDEREYFTQSYNHTNFQKPLAEFIGDFTDYGLDTDEDSFYNYLVVEAEINVTKAGEYELEGGLYYYNEKEGYWQSIDWDRNRKHLDTGIQNITLQFDGIEIYTREYNGSFITSLRLYETEEGNRIDKAEHFTKVYNYTDFQKPPAELAPGFNDYGLDTNDNLLYDYLVIEKEINVREAGDYRLRGWLESPSGKDINYDSNRTYLDIGLHNITLKFYGPSIYNSDESGNFIVDMDLYDADNRRWLDSILSTTKAYDHMDFERPPAKFTGNFDDYGLDIGEDDLYNYLVVESEINVTKAGEYRLSGDLCPYYEENIPTPCNYASNRTYLDAGIHNITLQFDGFRIYNFEHNGSFKVELRLYDREAKIGGAEYLTSYYNYTEFNPSPPIEIPVTEIYVFDGSSGEELWNISIRNCLAAAYPISDVDGDNVSELLINKWIMEDDEVSFSKIEIVKGIDTSKLWNKSFDNCFAVAYPVSDLNGDNVTELVVDTWRFEERGLSTTGVSMLRGTHESTPAPTAEPTVTPTPEPKPTEIPITEIFILDGHDGTLLWNRSVSEGYLAAAYPVTDFTGDNITEIAINAIKFEEIPPSTIIEIADGVDGTPLWSKTINNSFSAVYPATDLTRDGISELIINSWLFSDGFISKSEVLIVNGLDGAILWNLSTTEGLATTYPATDLTNNNVSEIIINVWGPELRSTKILIFEGLTHTELFSKTMSNSLAAAYPVSDLTGDNVSEVAINELNFEDGTANITILSINPSVGIFDTGEGTYPSIFGIHNGTIKPNQDVTVQKMYTYLCSGTGGHSEYVRIYNESETIAEAKWAGYKGDWHNITFPEQFTLEEGKTYNYTIKTGSYPQIIHKHNHTTLDGSLITCEEFIDTNGKKYTDRIPAIKFFW